MSATFYALSLCWGVPGFLYLYTSNAAVNKRLKPFFQAPYDMHMEFFAKALFQLIAMGAVLLIDPSAVAPAFTGIFMEKMVGFIKLYFPVFLLGAVFGKLIEMSGFSRSIVAAAIRLLGTSQAMLVIVLVCALHLSPLLVKTPCEVQPAEPVLFYCFLILAFSAEGELTFW